MDEKARYRLIWKTLYKIVGPFFRFRYKYTAEIIKDEGPILLVSNHVTNMDPFLVAMSLPDRNIHYVASEHLFRLGWVSKVISYLVGPIPRRKGANGAATAMACVRKIRAGSSVCIFAEGETTWDGRSVNVFPATGTVAKLSGAPLVTYRIEGGYLTSPRWGKGVRRGKMRGHVVKIYSPEELKAMTPAQIDAAMNADIYEDAWERQKREPVRYKGRKLAEGIDVALFLCPECRRVGGITGKGNELRCSCGMERTVTEYGVFAPAEPFENMAQWNDWQHDCLKRGDYEHGETLFADENMRLVQLDNDRKEQQLAEGTLTMHADAMSIGEHRFELPGISDMALIQRKRLAFMCAGNYYELRAAKPKCLRKYCAVWKNAADAAAEAAANS